MAHLTLVPRPRMFFRPIALKRQVASERKQGYDLADRFADACAEYVFDHDWNMSLGTWMMGGEL